MKDETLPVDPIALEVLGIHALALRLAVARLAETTEEEDCNAYKAVLRDILQTARLHYVSMPPSELAEQLDSTIQVLNSLNEPQRENEKPTIIDDIPF